MAINPYSGINEKELERAGSISSPTDKNASLAISALKILEESNKVMEDAMSMANSNSKENNPGVRRIRWIKRNLEEMSVSLKGGKITFSQVYFMIAQNANWIGQYDKSLAAYILNYKEAGAKGPIGELGIILSSPDRLLANLELAWEKCDAIENKDIKSKVRSRISLIEKLKRELEILENDLRDISNWGSHFNEGAAFYIERLQLYFQGGTAKDKIEFKAIDEFKDDSLKNAVLQSSEIKELFRFFKNVKLQANYISQLIYLLKKDLDPQGEKWISNNSTSLFFRNIEAYAQKFRDYYSNGAFADSLIKSKDAIGENPFGWIGLLDKEKSEILSATPHELAIIENARARLDYVFKQRIERIKSSINVIISSIRPLLGAEDYDEFIRVVIAGLARIEALLSRLWKERVNLLKNLNGKLDALSEQASSKLEEINGLCDFGQEGRYLAQASKSLVAGKGWMRKFGAGVDPKNENAQNYLGPLAFMVSEMEMAAEAKEMAFNAISLKENALESYDIEGFKILMERLLDAYLKALQVILALGLYKEKEKIKSAIKNAVSLRGEYNG